MLINVMRGVMRNDRVYVDTSVFGGVFDPGIDDASRRFFELIRSGQFVLVTSALVAEELDLAPVKVRDFFDDIGYLAERVPVTNDATLLQEAYLSAGVLTMKSEEDALHVALAVTSGCAMIISWNFKHIVHYDKIPRYNAVNVLHGYQEINIFSPLEVIDYDERV